MKTVTLATTQQDPSPNFPPPNHEIFGAVEMGLLGTLVVFFVHQNAKYLSELISSLTRTQQEIKEELEEMRGLLKK